MSRAHVYLYRGKNVITNIMDPPSRQKINRVLRDEKRIGKRGESTSPPSPLGLRRDIGGSVGRTDGGNNCFPIRRFSCLLSRRLFFSIEHMYSMLKRKASGRAFLCLAKRLLVIPQEDFKEESWGEKE